MIRFPVVYMRPPGFIVMKQPVGVPIMPEGTVTHSGQQPVGVPIMPEWFSPPTEIRPGGWGV